MKKYNLSKIMKKAWEIVKQIKVSFATALKLSWAMAKKEIQLKEYFCEPQGKVTFTAWTGYGKVRVYFKCDFRSKYQNNKGNFIEI